MAGSGGGDFYDLSIMYSPDGEQWSEFLSDVFRQGDEEIKMYFESIEQLPLHHSQETAIRNSRCQFLLVSPDFTDLFSYTSFRDLVPHPEQVVVLLCGVEHSHLQDIVANMPGYQKWTILSTTDGVPAILQSTFQVINSFEPEPDPESPYMPMAGKSQGDDTYLSMDQSNTRTQGQDVYEDMEAKPQAVGKFQDTYMVLPTLEDSGTDDSSGPPHRPPKPTQQKSRPDRAIMSKELQLVQPYTVTSGSGERVVLIFKNTLPEGGGYTVEFQGTKQTSVVTATKENPYTLVLSAPDHPPETTQATVKCDGKSLGNATMVFLSKMRRLEELLSDVSKPIEFMCQSLGTEPSDLKTLDKILRKTFKKHMPPNGLGVFGIDQESEEEYAYHPEELPTLMHFVAKYGLKDMCASLLHCPGALNACSIANCDNDFPHNMAEKYGHMDLKKYIEDRIVDPGYVYMAMGRYYNTHAALREGGYYNFFRSDSSVEEQPDYDHPFPVAIPDLDVYGETLSTNYIKDILQGHEQAHRSINTVVDSLNTDLATVSEWLQHWKLEANRDKCKVMFLTTRPLPQRIPPVILAGTTLQIVHSHKHLGVTLTSKLTWSAHVEAMTNKARRTAGMLCALRKKVPKTILLQLYKIIVRPVLEYADIVWGGLTMRDQKTIESVQYRSARVISGHHGIPYPSHKSLYSQFALPSLTYRRKGVP
ncbi:toll-like receptor 7 signaling pathway [Branchiostoma belcheri]|nr:toll-like receptor 7 signaling pathway [Branchiostoma belcheri]